MEAQSRTVEQRIAGFAGGAHGIVTRSELLAVGITRAEIEGRTRRGALLREYPGVYRVGHRAPSVDASYLAAVRACGIGALLAGRAAGHLLRLLRGGPAPPEVIALTERRIPGIRTHRSRDRDSRDAFVYRGIPVTAPARTLVDLAAVLPAAALALACHEAGVHHGTTPAQVVAVLKRRPKSAGAAKLRSVIHGETKVLLSRLESRFLELLTEHRLPLPETNRPAGGRRVDCRWPAQRLTVELDSYRFHQSRHAWELDRRREREAHARGDDHRRFTHDDVFEHPHQMLAELRTLLPAPIDPAPRRT